MIFINNLEATLSPIFDWPIIGEVGYLFGYLIRFLYEILNVNNIFLSILIIVIALNLVLFPLTYMKRKNLRLSFCIRKEKEIIDKKYTYTDTETSKIREKADKKLINLKYGVNKGNVITTIIQIFVLIGVYSAILNINCFIPNVNSEFFNIFGIDFSQTCGYRLTPALIVPVITCLFQYCENVFANIGYKDIKKIKLINLSSIVNSLIIGMFALTLPLFISIYWILSGIFSFIIATVLDKLYFVKHDNEYFMDKEIKKMNKKRKKQGLPEVNKEVFEIKIFEGENK